MKTPSSNGWPTVSLCANCAILVAKLRARSAPTTNPRRPALHEVEDAGRHARFFQAPRVDLGGLRRHLARLEDDAVSARDRRQDMAVRQVNREVERAEHREHAERPEAQLERALRRAGHQ